MAVNRNHNNSKYFPVRALEMPTCSGVRFDFRARSCPEEKKHFILPFQAIEVHSSPSLRKWMGLSCLVTLNWLREGAGGDSDS